MTSARGVCAVAAAFACLACSTPERVATNNAEAILEFASTAPYDVSSASGARGGLELIVADSALERYNGAFKLFATTDSSRASFYETLPSALLASLGVPSIIEVLSAESTAEGITVRIVIETPLDSTLSELVFDLLRPRTESMDLAVARTNLREAIARERKRLKKRDTVIFQADSAGQLLSWRTASANAAREHYLRRLGELKSALGDVARTATINEFEHLDLFPLIEAGMYEVSAVVRPSSGQWPAADNDLFASLSAECQAISAGDTSVVTTLVLSGVARYSGRRTLSCAWMPENRTGWSRKRPDRIRIRLVAPDSSTGPWFEAK